MSSVPPPAARHSLLAQNAGGEIAAARVRETAILLGCLNHATVTEALEQDLEEMRFLCDDLDRLRQSLLHVLTGDLNANPMTQPVESLDVRLAEFGADGAMAALNAVPQLGILQAAFRIFYAS